MQIYEYVLVTLRNTQSVIYLVTIHFTIHSEKIYINLLCLTLDPAVQKIYSTLFVLLEIA